MKPRVRTRIERDRYGLFAVVTLTPERGAPLVTTLHANVTASDPAVRRLAYQMAHQPVPEELRA